VEDPYFESYNFEQYGGVPVLGVAKPVIIGHGISHARSFRNMIQLAKTMIEKDLLGKIREAFV
jgi:glycerol-3-phosphate acyltransferase PlsX